MLEQKNPKINASHRVAAAVWLTCDILKVQCRNTTMNQWVMSAQQRERRWILRIVTFRAWCKPRWCLVRDSRAFCLSQTFGAKPELRVMNFWSGASSFNLHSPPPCSQVISVSCQVKHDRAVNPLTSSPSDHLSLIYSYQRSCKEDNRPATCCINWNALEFTSTSLTKPVKFFFSNTIEDFSFQRGHFSFLFVFPYTAQRQRFQWACSQRF